MKWKSPANHGDRFLPRVTINMMKTLQKLSNSMKKKKNCFELHHKFNYSTSKINALCILLIQRLQGVDLCPGHLPGDRRQPHGHDLWLSPEQKRHISHLTAQYAPKLLLGCLGLGQFSPSFHSHSGGVRRGARPGCSQGTAGWRCRRALLQLGAGAPAGAFGVAFLGVEAGNQHGSWQLLPQEQRGLSLTELRKPH